MRIYLKKGLYFMKELEYPFDINYLMKNRKKIKRNLLEKPGLINKKIANFNNCN